MFHTLIWGKHSIMQPIIKNKEENNIRAYTSLAQATTIAQAKGTFHSSYKLSLRQDYPQRALGFTNSCLGEISSPERDCPSPKIENPCMSYH